MTQQKWVYRQSKLVPGLWKHDWRPIQFTLVVNDFGVKYVSKEHALRLKAILKRDYKVTNNWTGTRYIGITLDWDYEQHDKSTCQCRVTCKNYSNNSNTNQQRKTTCTICVCANQLWRQKTIRHPTIDSTFTQQERHKIHTTSMRQIPVSRTSC